MSGIDRFDAGHELQWIPGVFDRANAPSGAGPFSLYAFDGAAGGPAYMRIDYLSLALDYTNSDVATIAGIYYYLGTSITRTALLLIGQAGITPPLLPGSTVQLSQPFVVSGPISLVVECTSSITHSSIAYATIAASLAYDLPT